MHDRQPLTRSEIAHHALGQIEHRPDLRDARAVEVCHGLEAAQPPLEEQAHQERLDRVVIVVPQRDLGKAQPQKLLIQRAAPHLGAHGAGIFLPAIVENDRPDLSLDRVEGHVQPLTKRRHARKIHAGQSHVDRDGRQLERLRVILAKRRQQHQQRQRVLPAGNAHGDPVVRLDHVIIVGAAPHKTHQLLHMFRLLFCGA